MALVDTHEVEALAADIRTRLAAVPPEKIAAIVSHVEAVVAAVPPEEVRAILDRTNQILEQTQDTVAMLKTAATNVLWVTERLKGVLK